MMKITKEELNMFLPLIRAGYEKKSVLEKAIKARDYWEADSDILKEEHAELEEAMMYWRDHYSIF